MNLFHPALALAFAVAMCGCATNVPQAPSMTKTTAAVAQPAAEPAPAPRAVEPAAAPSPMPPPAEAAAEKCDDGWVCVKVNLATGKIEKRATKLLGDPKIESTWSKQSDGRMASFDEFSQGSVQITLRRKPSNKNDVIVKLAKGGPTVVVDKHDGSVDEFTHIGAIAAEQDGALLLDLRYMR